MAPRSARRVPAPARRRARRAFLVALAAALACSGSSDAPPPTPEQPFDALWQDFDLVYPYFTLKGVDWDGARATYRPRAAAARSERELATVLLQMLEQLHDVHVSLSGPDGRVLPSWVRSYVPNFDRTVWSAYAVRWNVVSKGAWGYGSIGTVPYVYVDAWSAPLAGLDAVMEQFRDAPGLVIDVRMNGGGNNSYAAPLVSRLADQPRLGGYIRYRGGPGHDDFGPFEAIPFSPGGAWQFTRPVLLLVGPASMSSTEDFTSAMRELPHVTVAGATTGGASANPATRPLAEGWSYRVSRWWFTTADGIVVEGHGIPPHVEVPATPDDFAAGVDPVLEFAQAWAADPRTLRGP